MPKWDPRPSTQAYNPSRRYTSHSDRRGHYEEMRLRLPPEVAAQLSEIVASKLIGEYRRPSDIVVDGLIHHLARLADELSDPDITRTINIAVMLDDARRQKREREEFEELIRTINENAQAFYPSSGQEANWSRLREYCLDLIDKATVIPPEMRGRYLAIVEAHLKQAGGV